MDDPEVRKQVEEVEHEIDKILNGSENGTAASDVDNSNSNNTSKLPAEMSLLHNSDVLEKESEEGNVEYKWKLVNISPERFEHLVSQLKYRITEGQGEAIYEIGINDNGYPLGLNDAEFKESVETLEKMAAELGAHASLVCERIVKENPRMKVGEFLVRRFGDECYLDLRIAVCGNVDSGKSTLIGVLTRGQLDNGRGLARANVFQHKHELDTGRTSSISQQILGFDSKGDVVNYGLHSMGNFSWNEVIANSSKVCTFIDLAGHEKYLKTTVFGMTGGLPDYSCVAIGANMGITRMTKEHIGLSLALKIPFFVVITKIDMCPENVLKETISTVHKILKLNGVRKMPYHIRNEEDVIKCAKNMPSDRIAPIFLLSSVTGESLDLLRKFLNLLPIRKDWDSLAEKPAEVLIDQTFHVSGVGTVVSGVLTQGTVHNNDILLLGPDAHGHFKQVQIKSIQCKRVTVKKAVAGQHTSFALKKEKRSNIRKGMVMLGIKDPVAVWEFEAEVLVLYHSTTIQNNYQPVIHCMTVRQCAKIINMGDRDALRTGDKSIVRFRFMFRPEYLKVGERLIFREGRTKGLGMITKVFS
eukprot:GEZU01003092.1.p1 GENE.GEZU01003092.1~~GEZU01003092.1.p1  ORF type:complete len:585 (-),score=181.44 GEZU01003092.1:25-1779(-)